MRNTITPIHRLPRGVTEAEAAAAIEAIRADRPPFLVRFLAADARLETVLKAAKLLEESGGAVGVRWVRDERRIIVGIEIVEAGR